MGNAWLIARHEYARTVLKRRFLIITFAIPLGMAVLIALVIAVELSGESTLPVGYVDQAGVLDINLIEPATEGEIAIRAYPDTETALAALEAEQIQAFFILPPGYPDSLETDLYYLEEPPSGDAWRTFDDFIRRNLTVDLSSDLQNRLLEGPAIFVEDLANGRVFSEESLINVLIPIFASFFFMFATLSAGGYMLQVVADEKENRTMEVMLTSVTSGQMIGGKVAGLLAAALTQLAIYGLAGVIGILVAARYVEFLQAAEIPWGYIGVMALFFFPAYGLLAAVMVAIGSAVTELQEAQQISGFLNLFFLLPVMLFAFLLQNPNSPAMIFFTLFPTTSFLTISLRWGIGSLPVWQLVASWAILVSSLGFAVWAAGHIFRIGMLRYGQPLTWKAIGAALRGG